MLNYLVPLFGRKPYSRSTAALRSTGSVDSTGSDFGITPVILAHSNQLHGLPFFFNHEGNRGSRLGSLVKKAFSCLQGVTERV